MELEVSVGILTWLVANWVYLDLRRSGRRGFWRMVAFFSGWPATLGTLLVVTEGSGSATELDDRGLERLREEIRRDRRLRETGRRPEGSDPDRPGESS